MRRRVSVEPAGQPTLRRVAHLKTTQIPPQGRGDLAGKINERLGDSMLSRKEENGELRVARSHGLKLYQSERQRSNANLRMPVVLSQKSEDLLEVGFAGWCWRLPNRQQAMRIPGLGPRRYGLIGLAVVQGN